MDKAIIIGVAASLLTAEAQIPQLIKKCGGFIYVMYIILIAGLGIWL